MMAEFRVRFAKLTKKAQRLFMEGKITFGQAYQFSTQPHRFRKVKLDDLANRHNEYHKGLLQSVPFIDYPVHSIDDLINELARHSRVIRCAIVRGQLTLVQARFAKERSLGRNHLEQLTARNLKDLITSPVERPVHKAPRDLVTLRRPSSPRHLMRR